MRSHVTPGIRPYARRHMPPVAALPLRAPRRICKLTPHRHTCSCAQNENRKFWIAPSAAAVCVDRDHVWIASRWSPRARSAAAAHHLGLGQLGLTFSNAVRK